MHFLLAVIESPFDFFKGACRGDSASVGGVRGGAWFNNRVVCRSASRGNDPPDLRSINIGFRVAVDPPAGQAGLK